MLCPCRKDGGIIAILKLPHFNFDAVGGSQPFPGINEPIEMSRRGHRQKEIPLKRLTNADRRIGTRHDMHIDGNQNISYRSR
jgi:hypothetical protein